MTFNFLALPPEIRLQVYPHLFNPSKYRSSYRCITRLTEEAEEEAKSHCSDDAQRRTIPDVSLPRIYLDRSTPPILLVNRQITSEALPVLYGTTLTVSSTPTTYLAMWQMDLAEFICETLLQRMQFVVLKLTFPEKYFVFELLEIWGVRNELRRLVLLVPVERPYYDTMRAQWDLVERRLRTFADNQGFAFEMQFERPKTGCTQD